MTRRTFTLLAPAAGIAAGTLTFTGCAPATVLADLEAVLTVAEFAFSALSGVVGLAAPIVAMINGYLNSVSNAAAQASALIPATGILTPAIDVQIGVLFVSAIAPNLPAGVPQEIVTDIAKIGPAIISFLTSIGIIKTASLKLGATPGSPQVQTTLKKNITLSAADLTKLSSLRVRALILAHATSK
jgi:hypothetical protein